MARNFDRSNPDYIDFGNPSYLDITGDEITMSIWVRLGSHPDDEMRLFSKYTNVGSEWSYMLATDIDAHAPFIALFIGGGHQIIWNSGNTLTIGVWYHIVGAYDGSNMRLYIDGVEVASKAQTGNITSSTADLTLANDWTSSPSRALDGDLGHAGIWDVGLSVNEVQSLANGVSPLRIHRDNLLFYAPLNGQDPELDVVDGSSGTVNGSPTVAEEPPKQFNPIVAP